MSPLHPANLRCLLVVALGSLAGPLASVSRRVEEASCCAASPASSAQADEDWKVQRLTSDRILELHFPDVRLTSARHLSPVDSPHSQRGPTVPHTQVLGMIGGTIGFELLLPDRWNGRFVMGGGGGYVGTVTNMAASTLSEGYATAGTDTGHQWPSGNQAGWALNNIEAQVNFGYLAIHRTSEVCKALIAACYGGGPEFSYFMGCSTGGGQALMEAQRYPDDFQGIVSAAPVLKRTALEAARVFNAQLFFPDPNTLDQPLVSQATLKRLQEAVIAACDAQDGVVDGILDDPRECHFDLARFEELTPAPRRALQAMYDGPRTPAGQIYPGMPLGVEDQWFLWSCGSIPAMVSRERAPNPGFSMGVDFFKYFIFNNPNWDYSSHDLSRWEQETRRVATFVDANNPDLDKFKAAGGKLILWHGWSDGPLTPFASIGYFEKVQQRDPDVRDYFRLYLLPGVNHCAGGRGPDQVDWLAVLRRWVEQGQAPERLIASKLDGSGKVLMTRPVYSYPLRARYIGQGDTSDERNFQLPAASSAGR